MRDLDDAVRAVLMRVRDHMESIFGARFVRLVLFGSRARGDATAESDVDVLVILAGGAAQPEEDLRRASAMIADLSLSYDVVVSCVYVSPEQFEREQSPLMLNVRREGLVL